jgi:hypothetical protein
MKILLLLPIMLVLFLSGCAEQKSNQNSSTSSALKDIKNPEQTSQEFISLLEQNKWKGACELTDPNVKFSNCEQLLEETVSSFGKEYLKNFKNPSSTEINAETATVWFGSKKQASMTLKKIDGKWYYNAMVKQFPSQ